MDLLVMEDIVLFKEEQPEVSKAQSEEYKKQFKLD